MQKENLVKILLACLFVFGTFSLNASEPEEGHGGQVDTKEEIKAFIDHHLADSHYFTFFSDGKTGEHYGFSLPIILWDDAKGLVMFSSSKFHHGEELAEINGQHYKLYHSQIYKTDAKGNFLHGGTEHPVNPELIDFSITKNVLTMILVSLFLLLVFSQLARSYKKKPVPTGFGRFLEPLVIYVRDEIAKPNIGPNYKKYVGFIMTVFFFILLLNLLGITPIGVNVTGNIAITFCLAMFTFVIVQFSGNKHYWKHIFWMPGVPVIMKIVLIPIEVLGMFTKPFALMIRLFANMTAGHVVLMSLLGLIVVFKSIFAGVAFFGFTLFIVLIELLVAFLQAYIFALLSALYIGMAVEEHADHPNDHSDEAPVI
ncbi:MAG TPA: F0F1 ATP synthase subunit A [Flavobacteriaceae bacterium]|nr:F0F1 ATP synthase subunit A [Flavobacteriaceae bacterium]